MNNAILLIQLSNLNDDSFELFNYYKIGTTKVFEDEIATFNACVNALKNLINLQYDFEWLTINAKKFETTRRDFRNLCDDVCDLLGNRIEELCKHTRKPIITKPTKFEDYCPFPSDSLVVYGNQISNISIDGKLYKIVNTKIESTPYYTIYCNQIDF